MSDQGNKNNLMSMLDVSSLIPTRQKQQKLKKKGQTKGKNHRAGDWVCLMCNNLNYSFRKICNRCGLQTKKQNLIQALMLLNESKVKNQSIQNHQDLQPGDMYSELSLTRGAKGRLMRVPFGDITNKHEGEGFYSHFGNFSTKNFSKFGAEGQKMPLVPMGGKLRGFENVDYNHQMKGSGLMSNLGFKSNENVSKDFKKSKKKGSNCANHGSLCRGFNTAILLNEALKTPQKEQEEEREEYDSLKQIKAVKYIFDSDKKEKYPAVGRFEVSEEDNFDKSRLNITSLSFDKPLGSKNKSLVDSFNGIRIENIEEGQGDSGEAEEREFDYELEKEEN